MLPSRHTAPVNCPLVIGPPLIGQQIKNFLFNVNKKQFLVNHLMINQLKLKTDVQKMHMTISGDLNSASFQFSLF